ncbi:hypothetical protein ISTM_411 [Insectomime virus]|uniref:Uncharacterized protein n=1 Tax=Tunisvirus fontaine2 TaxID=1421067 RepID=V9SDZ1_9VIRU|nr:hypothetical protein D1R32_gp391 [Tunisvirus fontaine2]AHA46309.1 hypothetical protein ISTM_411 [Insectomime virus]AHC55108.1 hypothetical protein TNS_ORF390 [Tunisvirus fontaine2]
MDVFKYKIKYCSKRKDCKYKMSLTSEYLFDELDNNAFNGVGFEYADGIVKMEFTASNWDVEETKEEFQKLVKKAKEGKTESIRFESANGESCILVKDGRVHFCVAKYGGNGSGDISFSLPLELCLPSLEKLC